MRECIRCKAEMVEDLTLRQAGEGAVLYVSTNRFFAKNLGKVKAAVCPECGEISIYIEDTAKLKELTR